MRIAMNNKESLCIHSETIERVTQFAYLGSIIDNTGGTEADITARIGKAQTAFSVLNKIWDSTAYSMQTKLRIFNTKVKAVQLYGCETWKNSKSIRAKLPKENTENFLVGLDYEERAVEAHEAT
jgi:hypothetical protein